jgi:hypothetical protein
MKRSKSKIFSILVILIVVNLLVADMPYKIISMLANQASTLANKGEGLSTLSFVSANDGGRYNVTLWVRDWENKTSLGNLNVTIFDLAGGGRSSQMSNATGYIRLWFLNAGAYAISIQTGNRTVGFQTVNVAQNATYLVKS